MGDSSQPSSYLFSESVLKQKNEKTCDIINEKKEWWMLQAANKHRSIPITDITYYMIMAIREMVFLIA